MRMSNKVQLTVGHVTSVDQKHDWMSGQTTIITRFSTTVYHAHRPSDEPTVETLECGIEGCEAVVGISIKNRQAAQRIRMARFLTAWVFMISGICSFAFIFTGGASEYEYTIGIEPFALGATVLTIIGTVLFFWASMYTGVTKTHDKGHILQVEQLL